MLYGVLRGLDLLLARSRLWLAVFLATSAFAFASLAATAPGSLAADCTPSPSSSDLGAIGPPRPVVLWCGPVDTAARKNYDYPVFVDVPSGYWAEREGGGLSVEISWDLPKDDFNLIVLDKDGAFLDSSQKAGTTKERVFVPKASGRYTIRIVYLAVSNAHFRGLASFEDGAASGPGATFDGASGPAFGPATIVSAHFLGAEPQLTVEQERPGFESATDPRRMFVDWPLTSRQQTGQLSRSTDNGDSFRLLLDLACAQRNRPNCETGGGADTDAAVNPFTGTVYFTDQELNLTNEGLASSIDHGDTFPTSRQQAITSVSPTERQWLAPVRPSEIDGRSVEAFLMTRVPGHGLYIQAIGADGRIIPQPVPQIPTVGNTGPLTVDTTGGVADKWVYQPYTDGSGLHIATAPADDFAEPGSWRSKKLSTDSVLIFPWMALDAVGNAYMVWAASDGEEQAIFYRASRVDDPRNHPATGRPGTHWTPKVRVSLPEVGSAVFPSVIAGDDGRVAVAYMGTEDYRGRSDATPIASPPSWHVYAGVIDRALSETEHVIVSTGRVSHRVSHQGRICTSGAAGCVGSDRSLLDMIGLGVDGEGRLAVTFMDNHSSFARPPGQSVPNAPFVHMSKQVSGPSLLETNALVDVPRLASGVVDQGSDANWPNAERGRNLPALDLRGASLVLEGGELVARMDLADASRQQMKADLESFNAANLAERSTNPPAARLQYVVRFSTADEIYHLSMESLNDGTINGFGGVLDSEGDGLTNGVDIFGAGYHRDSDKTVTAAVEGQSLVLRAKASDFGIAEGTELFSVTGFAMAGPAEKDERTIMDPMRTVDATPPFDSVAQSKPDPDIPTDPTPTPTPTPPPPPAASSLSLHVEGKGSSRHRLVATLTDSASGVGVAGERIEFFVDGGPLGATTTDDSGVARLPLDARYRGARHYFEAVFRGSTAYGPSSASAQT